MKLKDVTREEWIEALESGKYRKGQGVLLSESDGRMCCLGVLSELRGVPRSELTGVGYPPRSWCPDWLTRDAVGDLAWLNDHYPGYPIEAIKTLETE